MNTEKEAMLRHIEQLKEELSRARTANKDLQNTPNDSRGMEDQEFIMWAKSQKIALFKRGELEVHFHPSAFVEKIDYGDVSEKEKEPEIDYKTDLSKVSDDDLFHSAN